MVIVLTAIYVVSSAVRRSLLGGLYAITPIPLIVILMFGLIGWTGIRPDTGSAMMIAMVAGIGADYAIYFLYRLREERRRPSDSARSILPSRRRGAR